MDDYDEFAEFDDVDIEVIYGDGYVDAAIDDSVVQPRDSAQAAGAASTSSATPSAQRKRKKAIPRPQSTYKLEDAVDGQADLLLTTVTSVSRDVFVCDESLPLSPPVKRFADNCIERIKTASTTLQAALMHFTALLTLIWPSIAIANRHTIMSQRRDASFSAYFQLRIGEDLCNKIGVVFSTLTELEAPYMFVQIYARLLHEKLLELHEKIAPTANDNQQTRQLGREEQNALRYTAGYVVHRMPKKILREAQKVEMKSVLENMTVGSQKETRLSHTREWVETQSRGGLCLINDSTFLFFVELEKIIRNKLPTTAAGLRDIDIRLGILDTMLQDRVIANKWTLLTAHSSLTEESSLAMLQILFGFYLQVRGFSFARNIVEHFKIKNKKQEKGSKGIRSSLKRQTEQAAEK